MCVPEHVAGGSGAIVGQFWRRRQRGVRHLLNVRVRRGGLRRFLLAERLFEGASQLQVENRNKRDGEQAGTHSKKNTWLRGRRRVLGKVEENSC